MCKSRLALIIGVDGNLVIARIPIKEIEERMFHQSLSHFVNEGQWEMIFLCCRIEFSVINAHSPPRDSTLRNKFIFSVFEYRHSSFLRNHLDGTNLVSMWYGINNPSVKKFEDFLLHNFSHRIIEPTLGFT